MLKIEPELLWLDRTRFLNIQVHESLAEGLPLELNFLDYHLF